MTLDCKSLSFLSVDYKSVVFSQQASGLWTDELLKLLKSCPSIEDLMNRQTDEDIKNMKPEVVLTLVGIKILKREFKQNNKEWRFVVAKAIQ